MTCAESILAGRPLITSRVCPALEYLAEAAVEAEPDDPNSYGAAIIRLSTQPELYERKRQACLPAQKQFYEPKNSWRTAMMEALQSPVVRTFDPGSDTSDQSNIAANPHG
jgi:glycosyltransferase involved in cell wall biosynthesis